MKFFGYPEVQLGRPINFGYDPHTNFQWPTRHAKRIDYRHIGGGDPKWIWELNRCQHLPLLVQAWLLTGDQQYADLAVTDALAWAEQNPPGRGIAWSNGYEAGVRAISLAITYDSLRGSEALTAAQSRRFQEILWQHGRWIERDPSSHSSANNHRMGELVGLIVICSLAPELRATREWFGWALRELSEQASEQILPDGFGAEQAFTYHVYVVDLLLVAVASLDAVSAPVPDPVLEALNRSGDAIWAQIGSGEPPLTYGDTDDAVAARLSSSELRDARAVAAGIAARLAHPRARSVARWPDATTWWLYGDAGRNRLEHTTAAADPGSVHLEAGGLVVLRGGSARATVDVGPLGFLSLAAHGHADALAVTWTRRGREVVCDPGVGSYFRDAQARDAFRGTGFHATVEVDGSNQSEIGGAFLWTRHARAKVLATTLEERVVFGTHDGYGVLPDPVRHVRAAVLLSGGPLMVCDLLEGDGSHLYAQHWPLAPDLEATVLGVESSKAAVVRVTSPDGPAYALRVGSTAAGEVRLVRGQRDPLEGWWSPRLESMQPAWRCTWATVAAGKVALAALISDQDPIDAPIAVALEGRVARIELGGGQNGSWRVDFDRLTVQNV